MGRASGSTLARSIGLRVQLKETACRLNYADTPQRTIGLYVLTPLRSPMVPHVSPPYLIPYCAVCLDQLVGRVLEAALAHALS